MNAAQLIELALAPSFCSPSCTCLGGVTSCLFKNQKVTAYDAHAKLTCNVHS